MRIILILTMAFAVLSTPSRAAALPSPQPRASAVPVDSPQDPCGDRHTTLLAALNRPTVGFSACAVKLHDSVAEIGYENESIAADAPSTSVTYPQGFMRYGVRKNLEIDYLGPAYGVISASGTLQRGWFDSGVGAKYEFFHDNNDVAGADILYTVPSGSPGFTNGGWTSTVNFDATRNLTSRFSVGGTLGLTSTAGSRRDGTTARYLAILPSLVATEQIGTRAQLYVEGYGATRIRPDGGSRFALDGGLQYLLSPQVEIDVEAGRTVTDIARSHFIGSGIGLRF